MTLAFFKPQIIPNAQKRMPEQMLDSVSFNVHKLNHRPRPSKKDRIKIISCFSEFGCETLGCMYCIPRLMKRFPGRYIIAMGWYGREYLYRHLVDEYWEIKEEYMWMRDFTNAFAHNSKNLKKIEEEASQFGDVIPSAMLGTYAVANFCRTCGMFWREWRSQADCCPSCKSTVLIRSIFTDIGKYKPTAKRIPLPSVEKRKWAEDLLKEHCKGKPVGIFARGRKTYGRNLEPDFYVKLIQILESMGYSPIWLGEKQSTQPCPVDHVFDFSRQQDSRDLEKTLSIVCHLDFTIQFWTASSRLSGMMGTPFLLFESPEQIYASYSGLMSAQEGRRLELCSFGHKKIVLAHYNNVCEDPDTALGLVKRAIVEMKEKNYSDIIGMIEDEDFTKTIQKEHYELMK